MDPRELRRSLYIVWLVLSTVGAGILAAPFVLPASSVNSLASACQAKGHSTPCVLCGMTTAFLLVSHGSLEEAARANRGGPPLYGAFVLNELVCLWLLMRRPRGSPGG